MINQGLDTVELLKERKKWFQEEVRRIDLALVAMGAESSLQKQKHVNNRPFGGIQWSAKIDDVFIHFTGRTLREGANA